MAAEPVLIPIAVGDTVAGQVDINDRGRPRANNYRFEAFKGETLTIVVRSDEPLYISLSYLFPDGRRTSELKAALLIEDEREERMSYKVKGDGLYVVRINGFEKRHAPLNYELAIASAGRPLTGRLVAVAGVTGGAASTSTSRGLSGGQIAPGARIQDCPQCPAMAVVPKGYFMMGSPASEEGRETSEGPRHLVTIQNPFAIGMYEVTFSEYDACVAEKGCTPTASDNGWGRGRRPVMGVTHIDAQRYAAWLTRKTGEAYFLPTEAEWEYSARAGEEAPWNTGDAILTDDANILNQFGKTVPVGSYPPNAFGLHDMHGNVAEWVQDCMDAGYIGAPSDGSAASSGDCTAKRIARGGGYTVEPVKVRSAQRKGLPTSTKASNLGFRVTRAID